MLNQLFFFFFLKRELIKNSFKVVYVRMPLEARGVRSPWSWSYRHCEAIEMGAGAQLLCSSGAQS